MASRARNRRRFKSSTSRLTMQSYAIKRCVLRAPVSVTLISLMGESETHQPKSL